MSEARFWPRARSPALKLAGLEAGPLAPYLYSGLVEQGLPVVCIETRRMKAFASASPVKTDRKDARLIALAMKAGLYRAVHIKTEQSQRLRFLLGGRQLLVGQVRQLEQSLRGSLKAFGLKLGRIGERRFAERVGELVKGRARALSQIGCGRAASRAYATQVSIRGD